jgi:hypothetical protein
MIASRGFGPMKALAAEQTQAIICESCGHTNIVEMQFSADLQMLVRCAECCHPQSLCQRHLAASADFPDFSVMSRENER